MGRSLDRSADPAQFFRVKPDRPVAERFIQNISAIPDANERAVTVRFVVSVVGGNETSRAGHVVNYELGIAGNMFSHMARNRARVGIVAPARRVTDADANRLTREEIVGHGRTPGHRQKKEIQREYAAVNWLSHIDSPHFCFAYQKKPGFLWLWGVSKESVPPVCRLLRPRRIRYRAAIFSHPDVMLSNAKHLLFSASKKQILRWSLS